MAEKALPCLCGSTNLYRRIDKNFIWCGDCHAEGSRGGKDMAEAVAAWNRRAPAPPAPGWNEAVEACAKLIEDGVIRKVAVPYRNDGVPSKNDRCEHGRWMYEDCEACCAVAIRALAHPEPHSGTCDVPSSSPTGGIDGADGFNPDAIPPAAVSEAEVEAAARAIEPKCYGMGDTKRQVSLELAETALRAALSSRTGGKA